MAKRVTLGTKASHSRLNNLSLRSATKISWPFASPNQDAVAEPQNLCSAFVGHVGFCSCGNTKTQSKFIIAQAMVPFSWAKTQKSYQIQSNLLSLGFGSPVTQNRVKYVSLQQKDQLLDKEPEGCSFHKWHIGALNPVLGMGGCGIQSSGVILYT